MIRLLRTFLGGFLMGSADLVPGVSGGTVALVIGIYERLVASIREGSLALGSLLRGDLSSMREHLRSVEWSLLVPLLAGILTAVVSLSRVIGNALETSPEIMAGAFFGLVVGSVVIAWRIIREPKGIHALVGVGVAVALFWALGLGEEATVADPSLPVFFASGALAICAMILPGISGSLVLVLLGMYPAVLGAVNDRELLTVVVFVLGATVGLALFSQVLHWALRKHHDVVVAALVGLMGGSLRVVWPWPDGVDSSALGRPDRDLLAVAAAAIVGLVAIFAIERLAAAREAEVSERLPV